MLVELHILQNFAPSNLNRDDTGSPKDCEFGGYRRARISSQSIKRAMRTAFREYELVGPQDQAKRTKRLLEEVQKRLVARGKDQKQAGPVIEAALGGIGLSVDADGKTQYLLFLGEREIEAVTDLCEQQWDTLAAILSADGRAPKRGRDAKRAAKEAVPDAARDLLLEALNGGRAADLALFGRMLADLPQRNIDAASQVAHAISTNRVSMEFDFYTAVDDLKPADNAGADMLGTIEFNSACFYRYSNVDLQQLATNLGSDTELKDQTIEAFIRASVTAIPTGKQNSMAAHNPPSLVFAVVRERGPWSLANAFLHPVRPDEGASLVDKSAQALDDYWRKLLTMYGAGGIRGTYLCTHIENQDLFPGLAESRTDNIDALVARVLEASR